jgi:hypothetical protein
MNYTVFAYLLYLPISVAMTIWVARTLHRNGRVFVVAAFRGNEVMGDSVNHLLVVGFYLINIGFITTALRYGTKPADFEGMLEFLSTKLGVVLLVLGAMHFFNLFNFDKMRRKGMRPEALATGVPHAVPPPLPPAHPAR